MADSTAKWMTFLEEGIKKIDTNLANLRKENFYTNFMDIESTKKYVEREQTLENMGAAAFWPEGGARPQMTFSEGWAQMFTQRQWAAGICVTKALRKAQREDLIDRYMEQITMATRKTKEQLGHYVLELGDVTTSSVTQVGGLPVINSTGGDGVELFDGSHPWASAGGTWSNLSGSADDVTETTIANHWLTIRRWTDNTGAPFGCSLAGIIFPPDLQKQVWIVMGSRLDPTTSNNAINTAPKFITNPKLIEDPWLSDTADWYLMTTAVEGKPKMKFLWEDEINDGRDKAIYEEKTGNMYTYIDFSLAIGANICRSLFKVSA